MDIDTFLADVRSTIPPAALHTPAHDQTLPVDLSRAAEIEITRDVYLEAQTQNLTLSELLESGPYDPSPAGSPLDAFERQLALRGIRIGGKYPATVELFYQGAPALLPEFMRREITRGMKMRPELNMLTASTAHVAANRYAPFAVDTSAEDTDLSLRPVADGANIPAVVVNEQLHTINVPDYGLVLKASYKALRHRTTDQFKVLLWYIGYRLQTDKMALLIDVLRDGDGNDNAAEVINTDSAGTLDYDDLVKFWAELHPFEMNTLVCSKVAVRTILNLAEFKDPMIGFKFQSAGELISPLGARLIRCDEVPDDLVIGMDRRFAVEEVITQPLSIEYDKVIEQRIEEAVISESVAYAKVIKDAAKVLDSSWT
ncbi:hypothetical protein ACFLQW_03280 [Candidatus Zixiibacteriota bacterium]